MVVESEMEGEMDEVHPAEGHLPAMEEVLQETAGEEVPIRKAVEEVQDKI